MFSMQKTIASHHSAKSRKLDGNITCLIISVVKLSFVSACLSFCTSQTHIYTLFSGIKRDVDGMALNVENITKLLLVRDASFILHTDCDHG